MRALTLDIVATLVFLALITLGTTNIDPATPGRTLQRPYGGDEAFAPGLVDRIRLARPEKGTLNSLPVGGLFELSVSLRSRRIARVIVCPHGGELFALHGFIKKSQKTPDGDLKLARRRKRKLETAR